MPQTVAVWADFLIGLLFTLPLSFPFFSLFIILWGLHLFSLVGGADFFKFFHSKDEVLKLLFLKKKKNTLVKEKCLTPKKILLVMEFQVSMKVFLSRNFLAHSNNTTGGSPAFLFLFYSSTVNLQCCVNYCYTSK